MTTTSPDYFDLLRLTQKKVPLKESDNIAIYSLEYHEQNGVQLKEIFQGIYREVIYQVNVLLPWQNYREIIITRTCPKTNVVTPLLHYVVPKAFQTLMPHSSEVFKSGVSNVHKRGDIVNLEKITTEINVCPSLYSFYDLKFVSDPKDLRMATEIPKFRDKHYIGKFGQIVFVLPKRLAHINIIDYSRGSMVLVRVTVELDHKNHLIPDSALVTDTYQGFHTDKSTLITSIPLKL
jgi:hypothetical protein